MILKFGTLSLIVLSVIGYAVLLWRANKPGYRLYHSFLGLIICGPVPLLLMWLVSYNYVPAQHGGYALALPVFVVVVFVIALIGDVFNL